MKPYRIVSAAAILLAGALSLPAQSVQQNIDSACVQVLGSPCSTSSTLYSTYQNIVIQINNRKLASDAASIMYNYLMPMVKSSTGWQMNVADWAWTGAGCKGVVAESQWSGKFGTASGNWQTYQQLVNLMKTTAGCTPASPQPTPAPSQYLTAAAMQPGYQQVWGALWTSPPVAMMSNCPASTGAVSCARSALSSYVSSHGAAVLSNLIPPVFMVALGFFPNATQTGAVESVFGRYWTGADDLKTYLLNTKSSWVQPAPAARSSLSVRMQSDGSLVDGSGRSIPRTQGSYWLSASGSQPAAYGPGTYVAWVKGPSGNLAITVRPGPAGGILVDNYSTPYKIVAQGGGNFALSNTYGIVAQGGGNIIGNGGNDIVAQGGGNLVGPSGGTFQVLQPADVLRMFAGVVSTGAGALISQDGGGLNPTVLASFVGNNSSAFGR